jgi:hypothetical protein
MFFSDCFEEAVEGRKRTPRAERSVSKLRQVEVPTGPGRAGPEAVPATMLNGVKG